MYGLIVVLTRRVQQRISGIANGVDVGPPSLLCQLHVRLLGRRSEYCSTIKEDVAKKCDNFGLWTRYLPS